MITPKIGYQIGVGNAKISSRERRYVNEALKSNRLSPGRFTQQFKNQFAKAHDCEYAVMCNSGTSALMTAIATLKEVFAWKDGDEILVPALTFVATVNVVLNANFTPVFVDIDPVTYNIDPTQIEAKITPRTRAIIPVHLFGLPCEMDPILEIAKRKNLRIIEDSCETMFSTYKGKPVGSFGDMACFSTYVAHLLVTGVGGVVTMSDAKYHEIARSLINHGRDPIYITMDDDKTSEEEKFLRIVQRRFRFVRQGYSFRMTEMEAALGVGQLEQKDKILKGRRKNAMYLIRHFKKWNHFLQLPSWPKYAEHSFMMFPIMVREPLSKWDLIVHLEKNNIETREMVPLTNQPVYRKMFGEDFEARYPHAKRVNECGFYIGCYQDLSKKELDYIISKFDEFFKSQVK